MERRNTSRNTRAARAGLLAAAVAVLLLGGAGRAVAQDPAAEAFQEIPAAVEPEAAAAPKGEFDYAAVDLRVAVWTDRSGDEVYRKGETMTVGFQTNADAYAVVYRIDTEGEVTVLWPRSRMDDGFVFGGHEYVLPVSGARQLRVGTAEGEGFVEAIVSRYPFDLRALELDFHHDRSGGRDYGFRVVGDPFLAINEVNYAITGLEDSEDFVVTNYATYYVHRQVDHPRYLCNQCHFDDGPAYDPYASSCSLNISVDYRWSNGWWATFGYYPAYYYPAYVYVDPWYWRPWVNYWYDPWWCAPSYAVCAWPGDCYPWYDHPYYGGGSPRYKPLSPGPAGDGSRTKTREYGPLSPMVAASGRDAVGDRAAARDGAVRGATNGRERTAWRGESRAERSRPALDAGVRTRGTAGLRLREGGSVRGGEDGARTRVRHTAGDSRTPSAVVPVSGGPTGAGRRESPGTAVPRGQQQQRAGEDRGSRSRTGEADGRTIRPVEPRQKGTRIWNTGRGGSSDGGRRPEQVRPGGRSGGSDSGRDGTVRSRRDGGGDAKTGGSAGESRTRSGGDSRSGGGSRDGAVRDGGSRSGGGSRDGGVRSGGSRGGGSDRSGGGSRSSGGGQSSGGSRGGGGGRSGGGERTGR